MTGNNANNTPGGDEVIEAEIIEETENTSVAIRTEPVERRIHKIRRWILRAALALAGMGLLVYLIAAVGYRLGLLDLSTSLGTLPRDLGPKIFMAGLVLGIASVFMSWFVNPRKGVILSLLAFAIPLGGILKGVSVQQTVAELPFIHDMSTDPEDPPQFTQTIIDSRKETNATNTLEYFEKKDKPNGTLVSVLQSNHYPDIVPVRRTDSPSVIYGEAKKLLGSRGWKVVTEDEDNMILEATDTTFWYGFKDDVILRIRPSKNGGSIIDMRSVSRVGGSDLGVNAQRLRELISDLKGG